MVPNQPSDNSTMPDEILAQEILAMGAADQQMRRSTHWDDAVDRMNTQRMKEIVARIGWPAISKVGAPAARTAWLLVQHADHDLSFQRVCLELMRAQPSGEVSPVDIAYLEDRVHVAEGVPQRYGTQFSIDQAGHCIPRPIAEPEHVDERRAALGLQPLDEYAATLRLHFLQTRQQAK